jgi:ACR3 family arsenite efflux pump ArsB
MADVIYSSPFPGPSFQMKRDCEKDSYLLDWLDASQWYWSNFWSIWGAANSEQVLIWTGLAGGDNEYCAILVAINSVLQIVLYAPLAILFINIISGSAQAITVSYSTVATSVAVFLGIPLGGAVVTRAIIRGFISVRWYDEVFLKWIAPWSLIGLLCTILVLFASQGRQVVHQIVSVVRVAAPLVSLTRSSMENVG